MSVGRWAHAIGVRILVVGAAAATMGAAAPEASIAADAARATPTYTCDTVEGGVGRGVGADHCVAGPGAPAIGPVFGSFVISNQNGSTTLICSEVPRPSGYARTPGFVEGRSCTNLG